MESKTDIKPSTLSRLSSVNPRPAFEQSSSTADAHLAELVRKEVEKSTSSLEDRIVQAVLKNLPQPQPSSHQCDDEEENILDALRTKNYENNKSKDSKLSIQSATNLHKFIQDQNKKFANIDCNNVQSDEDGDEQILISKPNRPQCDYDERIAPQIMEQIAPYGSFKNWVRTVDWKKMRNKNEAESLASAVDYFISENIDPNSLGLETLLRRLNGVQLADTTNNWSVCSALQWTGPNNSLLPRHTLTTAYRQAAQMERLTRSIEKFSQNSGNQFQQNNRTKFQKFSKFPNQSKGTNKNFLNKNGATGGNAGGGSP